MRYTRVISYGFVLLSVLWTGCMHTPPPAPKPVPAPAVQESGLAPATERIVVVISVDGLAGYYLDDPRVELPTIRRLVREGASCAQMKCAMPSVTWPTHTTLATGVHPGRHGVIGNSYWDRTANKSVQLIMDPLFDKEEIVRTPTIYDVAHAFGLRTAAICWPASRNAPVLDWTVPDITNNEQFQKYATPSWLAELRAEHIPFEMQEEWSKAPTGGVERDWLYTRMARQVIRRHHPNLLLLHLIETDHVQHNKGPQTPDAYWACSHEDDRVRDVFEACQKYFPGRATFIVVSDHGFMGYNREIRPNVLLRQAQWLQLDGKQVVARRVTALSQGGSSFVYVLDQERRAEILAQLVEKFRAVEGIAEVVEEGAFARFGLAPPARDPRMPDLILTAREGFSFSDSTAGDVVVMPPTAALKGAHGYDSADPNMRTLFVAWGAGIRHGVRIAEMDSTDVAPTVARLLGVTLPGADGHAREEILAP